MTRIDCGCCHRGLISDYGNGEDFYGPKDCPVCLGTGFLYETNGRRLVVYPGGPFRGMRSPDKSP